MTGRKPAALAAALSLALLAPGSVLAPVPGFAQGAGATRAPAAPAAPAPVRFLTADSVALSGSWFAAPGRAPSLVLAPRRRGPDAELEALAAEFQRRGFATLVFALRDGAPASREADSLRYAVMTSNWVEDVLGALRATRARQDGSGHLFVWGQGLGAGLAISAIGREQGLCDGVVVEDFFPSADFLMRQNGTSVIPDAVSQQKRLLKPRDEPRTAATRLELPVLAVLTGPTAGKPDDPIEGALRQNKGRTDRWLRPGVTPPAPTPGAAQVDSIGAWFKHWSAFPPIAPRTEGASGRRERPSRRGTR